MHGVALGHEDLLVVDNHGVAAVGAPAEDAGVLGAAVHFHFILAEAHLHDLVGCGELLEDIDYVKAVGDMGGTHAESDLLVVECLPAFLLQEFHYLVDELALAHAPRSSCVVVCFHFCLFFGLMKRRDRQAPDPTAYTDNVSERESPGLYCLKNCKRRAIICQEG